MTIGRSYAAALVFLALTGAAAAEAPDDQSGRFTMSPVDGGFLRLDKQTGAVAMCAHTDGEWVCAPVQDRTSTKSDELSKLKAENQALKERVKDLERTPGCKGELPTDEEVDQALDYMERLYKKIRDRIKNLEKPLSPPPADTPTPKAGAL
jgi:hypothetical protein